MADETFDVSIVLKAINRSSSALKQATKDLQNIAKTKEKVSGELFNAANLTHAADMMNRFAGKMRSAFAKPIALSEDFGAAMSKVQALSGSSAGDMVKLRNQAEELGRTTRYTAVEAADAMGFMAMAGFDTNKIMETLPTTMSLATAAGTDLGRTSDILTDVMGAFGLSTKDTVRTADVLTRAFTGSNTTLENLFETMTYAAPVAKQFGVEIESVAAMAGVLGSAGIKGSRGGTALRSFFSRLTGGGKGKMDPVLSYLKINPQDLKGNLRDPLQILKEVAGKLEKEGTRKRGALVKMMFGEEAMPAVLNMMRQIRTGEMDQMIAKMNDVGKTADGVALIMGKNAKNKTKLYESALDGLSKVLGDSLAPSLDVAKDGVIGLATFVSDTINTFPVASKVFVGIAGATTVLATALGGLAFVIGTLAAQKAVLLLGFAKIGAVFAALKTAALAVAPAAAPITAVAAALTSLGTAIAMLYKNWEQIKGLSLGGIWSGFKEVVGEKGLSGTFGYMMKNTYDEVKGVLGVGSETVPGVLGGGSGQSVERTKGVTERRTDVGGEVKITVDDQRAWVSRVQAKGPVNLVADAGAMGDGL